MRSVPPVTSVSLRFNIESLLVIEEIEVYCRRLLRPILSALFASVCIGCATMDQGAIPEANDPLEKPNRAIFKFNQVMDRRILRPITRGYRAVTPDRVEQAVHNFFDNLTSPIVIASDLLQAKFKQAGGDTGRFLLNSTVGVLGFIDVARHVGLEGHDEDFGQTLGKWGFGQGPYLMVPFFGPYTVRDGIGRILEFPLEPLTYYHPDSNVREAIVLMYYINRRARLLGADQELDEAFDPYIFVRSAYLQRRRYLVYDGMPPSLDDDFESEYSEEDFLNDP